ncbi:hypothetical protein SCHPADRAFT_294586 [Schizopora paradoxa]|uniref:Enhancer of polycomb-like protein n=1 Tax=Schizopora paradoxa TaxID=27342 RepID=A0A0H2SCZ4_9AGAM|nr:hypothetical protein SCHPADRAFT_294586 [Schizopora paradoxa]
MAWDEDCPCLGLFGTRPILCHLFFGPARLGQLTDASTHKPQRRRRQGQRRWPPFFDGLSSPPLPPSSSAAHDMPRNQNAGNLALRNRNRVTNKTRLKVIKGNIEADPIILDEDEERARVISTAGVDAEDANEHHLQAVLSAASHRATTLAQKASRGPGADKNEKPKESTAFIPVPDAAGVVEEYSTLYPSDKWVDPFSFVKFSSTIDECIAMALVDGFTYFMDERDAEWLEKNNQDARGEGTSSQAARVNGAHSRSARSKGKDVDAGAAVPMTEDDFELVMGVFEKITHDNTPFLHVQGTIPPFSDYQDAFSNPLPKSFFATYICPANLPDPPTLLRMARAVYPYWKERRTERDCHRIIPNLNFDESDVKNESYICFRRREIKAVRKTRTAQASSSDKLIRLKGELSMAFELGRLVHAREVTKRSCTAETRSLWDKRLSLADLKKKFPTLTSRDDEELLVDKERAPRAARRADMNAAQILRIKNRPSGDPSASPTPAEPQMKPKEKLQIISNLIEDHIRRQRDRDHHWEDQVDNPYQQLPLGFSERLFRPIQSEPSRSATPELRPRAATCLRMRVGRGGLRHIDRRGFKLRHGGTEILNYKPRRLAGEEDAPEQDEDMRRLEERWRFDSDFSGFDGGTDEEDRVLVDDFDTRYVRHSMHFLQENDNAHIATDPRLFLHDGQSVNVVMPFKVSPQISPRRESVAHARPPGAPLPSFHPHAGGVPISTAASNPPQANPPQTAATPIAVQTPVKKMPPPPAPPVSVRSASNGPQRPPSVVSQSSGTGPASSPPAANSQLVPTLPNGNHVTSPTPAAAPMPSNGAVASTSNGVVVPVVGPQASSSNGPTPMEITPANRATSPVRPKSQNQTQVNLQQLGMPTGLVANGITNGSFAGFNSVPNSYAALTQQQAAAHVLMQQQQQASQLKRAYAGQGMPLQQQLSNVNGAARANQVAYAQLGLGGNVNINNLTAMMPLKLPASRQMQWAAQRPQSAANGTDALLNQNIQLAAMNGGNAMAVANGMNGLAAMNGMNNLAAMTAMNAAMTQMNAMNGVVHSSPNGHAHMSPPNRHAQAQSPPNSVIGGHNHTSPAHAHQLLAQSLSPHGAGMVGSPSQVHLTPPRNMQTPIPGPQPSPLMQHQHIVGSINQGQGF